MEITARKMTRPHQTASPPRPLLRPTPSEKSDKWLRQACMRAQIFAHGCEVRDRVIEDWKDTGLVWGKSESSF